MNRALHWPTHFAFAFGLNRGSSTIALCSNAQLHQSPLHRPERIDMFG
jgi:hypothetical protein